MRIGLPQLLVSLRRTRLIFSHISSRQASSMVSAPTEWTQVVKDSVPPYSLFKKPIEKSQQDDREYRILKLANGLEAMIVHDSKADKAAASLDVAVGHLYDPVSVSSSREFDAFVDAKGLQDDVPGLAHFCEHLLFMVRHVPHTSFMSLISLQGTEQFPKENEYSEVHLLNSKSFPKI
jgi:insulysin